MWNLDNRASNYMCGGKDKFMKLDKTIKGNFTFADHSEVAIKGKYMILIKLKYRRDRKSTRLNSSHRIASRMPSSA